MRPGRFFFVAAAGLGLFAGIVPGCREPTQVTFDVSTVACDAISGTTLTVGVDPAAAEDRVRREFVTARTSHCEAGRIGTLVVTRGDENRAAIVVVAGYGGQDPAKCTPENGYRDCIVARRVVSFEEYTSLWMPIRIDPTCLNVPCDAVSTCRAGKCFASDVRCTSTGRCGEPGVQPGGEELPPVVVDGGRDSSVPMDATFDGDATPPPPVDGQVPPYCAGLRETREAILVCTDGKGGAVSCEPTNECCAAADDPTPICGGAGSCAGRVQLCCKQEDCAPNGAEGFGPIVARSCVFPTKDGPGTCESAIAPPQ